MTNQFIERWIKGIPPPLSPDSSTSEQKNVTDDVVMHWQRSLRDKVSRRRPFDKNSYKKVAEELTRKDIFMPTVAPQNSVKSRRVPYPRGLHTNNTNSSLSGHVHPGRDAYSQQQIIGRSSVDDVKGRLNPSITEGNEKETEPLCTESDAKIWVEHRAVSSMFKRVLSKMQQREYPHVTSDLKKTNRGHYSNYSPIKPISRLRSDIHESIGKSYESSDLEMVIMKRSNVR